MVHRAVRKMRAMVGSLGVDVVGAEEQVVQCSLKRDHFDCGLVREMSFPGIDRWASAAEVNMIEDEREGERRAEMGSLVRLGG